MIAMATDRHNGHFGFPIIPNVNSQLTLLIYLMTLFKLCLSIRRCNCRHADDHAVAAEICAPPAKTGWLHS